MHHLGLPGGHAYPMMNQYLPRDDFITPDHRIDPSLMRQGPETYESGYISQQRLNHGVNVHNEPPWDETYGLADQEIYENQQTFVGGQREFDHLQLHDQHTQMLQGSQDGWSVEPLDVGQEFDKWMDEI